MHVLYFKVKVIPPFNLLLGLILGLGAPWELTTIGAHRELTGSSLGAHWELTGSSSQLHTIIIVNPLPQGSILMMMALRKNWQEGGILSVPLVLWYLRIFCVLPYLMKSAPKSTDCKKKHVELFFGLYLS